MSQDIISLLNEPRMLKICAPMVRYSKLPFRTLVRKYDCDICFTPMILADSFVQSSKARNSEFSTSKSDRPLIVQFAAKTIDDFLGASEMIAPYADGVDLNCGCPQRWAMKDGYGAALLNDPQLVKDLANQVRNRIPKPFTVSVKIRILKDIKKTIELCQAIQNAGSSFITIHARTPEMRNEPIDLESLKLVCSSVDIPVIANGNVKCLEDAINLYNDSKCSGIMVANGLLTNPALFSGFPTTPIECIQNWLDISSHYDTQFQCMHHHFVFMLEKVLNKKEKLVFNVLNNKSDVHDFLNKKFNIVPRTLKGNYEFINCNYDTLKTKVQGKVKIEDECDIDLQNFFI